MNPYRDRADVLPPKTPWLRLKRAELFRNLRERLETREKRHEIAKRVPYWSWERCNREALKLVAGGIAAWSADLLIQQASDRE